MSEIRHELDVAKAVASGELPSPTEYGNSKYFRLRISGTGVAWRGKHQEFCYRPKSIWTSPEMIQRVSSGLLLIFEHPPGGVLDGKAFYERVAGVCTLGFVVEGADGSAELWAVARVVDEVAAGIIASGQFDTSPACSFDASDNSVLQLNDGPLLLEGNPRFLDHVALIFAPGRGVWSKGGEDLGVDVTPENETEKELADA